MIKHLYLTTLLFLATYTLASVSPVPQSLRSTVSQYIGKTQVSIEYSRPNVKEREIFGALVPYGEVWRTGANVSTSIEFDTPLSISGSELPAGRYSLFTIPEAESWTIIINSIPDQFGAFSYDQSMDSLRFTVKPKTSETHIESFEIAFSDLDYNVATIQLRWANTIVPISVSVSDESNHQVMLSDIENDIVNEGELTWGNYGEAARYYVAHNLDLDAADKWFATCLELNPNAFWMHVEHANLLISLDRKEDARTTLEAGLASAKRQNNKGGTDWVAARLAELD